MMKFRKAMRYLLLGLLIILALAGIPVVPPKKIEMDDDDETKTELVEEKSDKN